MLQKRIDLGSIPFGLYKTKDEMVKGRLVKFNQKDELLEYATKDDEANAFITLRIETNAGGDIADHDKIAKGVRAVAYTLVKDNIWSTTNFPSPFASLPSAPQVSVSPTLRASIPSTSVVDQILSLTKV